MPIYAIDNLIPVIEPSSFIHPSAEIIGDVIIEKHCYIGPNAVLRGDFGRIVVGAYSNVQDNCVIHSFPGKDCILAPYSHIGHGAILHGCQIGENCLIGMNSVVMDDANIGAESIISASAFVKSGFVCDKRSMVVGAPAKIIRQISDKEISWKTAGTEEYIQLSQRCHKTLRPVTPLTEVQADRPRYQQGKHQLKAEINR